MKIYRIYCYQWNDGHIYVGKTFVGSDRIGNINGYRHCLLLLNYWKKHGKPHKINILQDNICQGVIQLLERYYIKKMNSFHNDNPLGLNLTTGGENSAEVSKLTKLKMSISSKNSKNKGRFKKGMTPWNKGKHGIYSKETLKSISEKQIGKVISAETRKKMSITRTGHPTSEETKRKISLKNFGSKRTLEQIKHISDSHKGIHPSLETRQKMSENRLGRKWIHLGENRKLIKSDELDKYISKGWQLGKKKYIIT